MGVLRTMVAAGAMWFPVAGWATPNWSCGTTPPQPIPVFQQSARDFATHTSGRLNGTSWRFSQNGYAEDGFVLPNSALVGVLVKVRPLASVGGVGAYWPELQVSIDGMQVANITVDDPSGWTHIYVAGDQPGIHRSPVFAAGQHTIRVAYTNDWAEGPSYGRDLEVEDVLVYMHQTDCTLPLDYTHFGSLEVIWALAGALDVPVGAALEEDGGRPMPAVVDEAYQAKLHQFRYLTPTNPFKMASVMWDGGVHYGRADAVVDYLGEHHKEALHGHTLVWDGSLPVLPDVLWVPQNFEAWLDVYIANMMQRYAGLFETWHVVNEPLDWEGNLKTGSPFYTHLGEGYLSKVWSMAERASEGEDVDLILNENSVLDLNEKSDGLYREVALLLAQGHQVDGVGFQAHIDISHPPNFSEIRANIDRFEALGVDVHLTDQLLGAVRQTQLPPGLDAPSPRPRPPREEGGRGGRDGLVRSAFQPTTDRLRQAAGRLFCADI